MEYSISENTSCLLKTLSNVENDKQEGLNKQEGFSEIEMEYSSKTGKNEAQENNESEFESENKKKKRVPRRVIHFSDGIVEEFSTDSEDEEEKRKSALIEEEKKKYALLDPKKIKLGTLDGLAYLVHGINCSFVL